MRLESHATPNQSSPEQRYAALHRAIERGMVSDAVWRELATVSTALGHADEAQRCIERVDNEPLRLALQARLKKSNVRAKEAPEASPVAAPAASSAGPGHHPDAASAAAAEREKWNEEPTLREHLADAVQFLFVQHMPWLCLLTTLAFPLVIGLGGFLTAGASPFGLAAISALPGACVLAVVAAMARTILLESSHGAIDPPAMPGMRSLLREAARWTVDGVTVLAALSTPVVAAWWLGVDTTALIAITAIAALVAPMAFCISELRGLKMALSPLRLAHAVVRGGLSYAGLSLICWAIFALPVVVSIYVLGQPVWVQITAIGPTAVMPSFLVARLLGTWMDTRNQRLGDLMIRRPKAAGKEPQSAPARPARPAGRQPQGRPTSAAKPRKGAARTARRAGAGQQPTAKAIEGRGPRRPQQRLTDAPDLSQLPGAVTVSGKQRQSSGAASRHS